MKIFNQRILYWIGFIWAFPITAIGLCFWIIQYCITPSGCFTLKTPVGFVFIAHSGFIAWLLQHHFFSPMSAMVLGHCIIAQNTTALNECWEHELVHVRQTQQFGIFFPIAYGLCSVYAKLNGGCVYADNYFEKQARLAEKNIN